jgi:hypothetical protein
MLFNFVMGSILVFFILPNLIGAVFLVRNEYAFDKLNEKSNEKKQ